MSLHDISIQSQLDISRPRCPKCGTPMWLARVEPDQPNCDRRTHECPGCNSSITEVVKYR